jgi:hypothetical protein
MDSYHWKYRTSNFRRTQCRRQYVENFDTRYIKYWKLTSKSNLMYCPVNVESKLCNKVELLNIEWANLGRFWWVLMIACEWVILSYITHWTPNIENRGTLHRMSPYNSVRMSNFELCYSLNIQNWKQRNITSNESLE